MPGSGRLPVLEAISKRWRGRVAAPAESVAGIAVRERLLNAPALVIMCAVVTLALFTLFPRQPAFRDPANLHARDQLSIAYMRVLVRSDPENVALRLSFVKVLTEAGLDVEASAALAIILQNPPAKFAFETGLAHVRLSLQRLYRGGLSEPEVRAVRSDVEQAFYRLLKLANDDAEQDSLLTLARAFGEPAVLAELHERLSADPRLIPERRAMQLGEAAKYRLASNSSLRAAQLWRAAWQVRRLEDLKQSDAELSLRSYLSAAQLGEGLSAAREFLKPAKEQPAPALLGLAADIAQQQGENESARRWLHQLREQQPDDVALSERLLRLELALNNLPGALELALNLRARADLSAEQRELLARTFDWNQQLDHALEQWLPLALAMPTAEREQRAFALSTGLNRDDAVVALVESAMRKRRLRSEEASAYLASGLRRYEPARLQLALDAYLGRQRDDRSVWLVRAQLASARADDAGAVLAWQRVQQLGGLNAAERMLLAREYWRTEQADAALSLLLAISKPDAQFAADYWRLLADVAWYLERDTLARSAYSQILARYAPFDATAIARLFRLAQRNGQRSEIERWAQYGWQQTRDVRYFIALLIQAYRGNDMARLDALLSEANGLNAAESKAVNEQPDYWQYLAERAQAKGRRSEALSALDRLAQLRLHDANVVATVGWTRLAQTPLLKPGIFQLLSTEEFLANNNAELAELMAAMQQTLAQPAPALNWFERALTRRHGDFFWVLAMADDLEWLGCAANANQARLLALNNLAVRQKLFDSGGDNRRFSEQFYGSRDRYFVTAEDEDDLPLWQQVAQVWGLNETGLDNARFYALRWLSPRLNLSEWRDLAAYFVEKDQAALQALVRDIQVRLALSPREPDADLPLSLNEVADTSVKLGKDEALRGPRSEMLSCQRAVQQLQTYSESLPVLPTTTAAAATP